MPRTRRIIPLEAALHIICRGNNRQNVFHNDNDKLRYYTLLCELKDKNGIDILSEQVLLTIPRSTHFPVTISMQMAKPIPLSPQAQPI